MLTPEQIKNLKPGDIIYLNNYPITFCDINYDKSTISARDDASNCGEGDLCWFTIEYLTMQPKPKYDPTRLFKKGDIVKLKDWNGRCPVMYSGTNSWFNHPPRCKNGNLEVREDEKNSRVEIGIIGADCAHAAAAPAYLELVTPVEELEPYFIHECTEEESFDIFRHGGNDYNLLRSVYYYKTENNDHAELTREEALAAAEAECKRLNEEWRKEQNND